MMKYLPILIVIAALHAGGEAAAEDRFRIESAFGKEAEWTEAYLNDAWKVLVRLMDNRAIDPPRGIHVTLEKDPTFGGIGGRASPTSLGFTSNVWPKDRHRLWILAHELTNLFAAHYGGAGGYPADWWANGRSPFPEYVSCLVMEKLGHHEAAAYRKKGALAKPDHALYWKIHERYGFKVFSRFFKLVCADSIDIGRVGKPWPHPDEARSAYTIAYLSIAAGEGLAPLCREHGIGREPPDWSRIHPGITFVPYTVSDAEVEGVIAVREHLFTGNRSGRALEILREVYREGAAFRPDRNGPDSVAGGTGVPLDDSEVPDAATGPIAFLVRSEFGAESAWTEAFLGRTAAAMVRVFDLPAEGLPERIAVTLRKQPDLGGIMGGAEDGAIDLVSDCWPEEPFRHWILVQETASLLARHLGGNLPADWWGTGGKPFSVYAAVLVLRKLGLEVEADRVRDMHRSRRDHELFWALHDKHGAQWVGRFFRRLRVDGIDFDALVEGEAESQRARSLHLIAYITLACGENVASLCAGHDIGKRPPGWDDRNGENPFRSYRITREDVEKLLDRRN